MSLESKLQFLVDGIYAELRLEQIAKDYDNATINNLGTQREQSQ